MKRGLLKKAARRAAGALWGALALNGFVYNACARSWVRRPDIPVRPVEFYGQCGEDLIVLSLLQARALRDGIDIRNTRYLEIGGNHPFAASATYLLHKAAGMTGVIVEANASLISDLKKGRPLDTIVHAAVQTKDVKTVMLSISRLSELSSLNRNFVLQWNGGSVGEAALVEVPALRMNEVVSLYLDDKSPSFLSIDVEGMDLMLLQDFDLERYRPWFIQIEPSDDYIPENTNSIIKYLRSANYELVSKTNVNLIFNDAI